MKAQWTQIDSSGFSLWKFYIRVKIGENLPEFVKGSLISKVFSLYYSNLLKSKKGDR